MKNFAFAVFILVSLTAVSSQSMFTGNWLLDWQSQNSTCAPSSFLVTWYTNTTQIGNSYSTVVTSTISYIYPYNLSCPSSFTSNLYMNQFSGLYYDDMGQTVQDLGDNTLLLVINSTLSTPILFSRNGAYISKDEVAGLVTGIWTDPVYSSACVTSPPFNISITVQQSYGGINSPLATYFTSSGSYGLSNDWTMTLFIPQIDQFTWQMWYAPANGNANISYIVNSTTNEVTLQFQIPQNSSSGICIGTYTRSLDLFSGTWYPDWQDGNISSLTASNNLPTSIQVINNALYLGIVFNFSNSSSITGILYPIATYIYNMIGSSHSIYYTDSVYGYLYYPDSSIFATTISYSNYTDAFMYSQGGSAISAQPFLGNWSSPVNFASDCCVPQTVIVTNSTTSYNLSVLFQFDSNTLETDSSCSGIKSFVNGTSLQMFFNIKSPNPTYLSYYGNYTYENNFAGGSSQGNFDAELTLTSSNQLMIDYGYETESSCSFTMTQEAPEAPSPLSHWILKGISVGIFALIVISL